MKILAALLILAIQTMAYAYLTPPSQTLMNPTAPRMVPLGGGGLAGYTAPPLYNLGLSTNLNSFMTPTFNSLYRPIQFPMYQPVMPLTPFTGSLGGSQSYPPAYNSFYSPMTSPTYFPNYGLNSLVPMSTPYFPTSFPSYFPSSSTTRYSSAPLRLASNTSPSDTYNRNERIPIRSASTTEVETYASSDPPRYSGGDRIALASATDSSGQTPAIYRTVVTTPSTGAHAPRAVTRPVGRRVTPPTTKERKAQTARIWKPFMERFKSCVPDCEPTGYDTWGERGNDSCHPEGLAIDISGMYCSSDGRHYSAKDRWNRFQTMVECMKTQMRFYRVHPNGRRKIISGVLYRQNKGRGETRDHWDHAHFSLGCKGGWVY